VEEEILLPDLFGPMTIVSTLLWDSYQQACCRRISNLPDTIIT
jgi:hypothetical protein